MSTSKEKKMNKRDSGGFQDGYWERYSNDGQLIYKCNFINGFPDGWWERYYVENGQLATHGNYVNRKENGWWEYFNLEGNLTKSIFYVNI